MYKNEKLTVYADFLRGKTASVIGLGISNQPLVDFLLRYDVRVTVRDKKTAEQLRQNPHIPFEEWQKKGVKFVTGEDYLENIHEQIVYKSPGVRFDKPQLLQAQKNGSLITGEMEAFLSLCPCKIIAVTGSNGKTTTTSLVAAILENAGKTVYKGGNIGHPLLAEAENMTPEAYVVLELSSFQLHTVNRFENAALPFAHITFPDVGVVTNVSPNHLDWHTDMDEYALSKRAVFTHMKKGGKVVLNRCSDAYSKQFAAEAAADGQYVSTFSAHDGFQIRGASLDDDGYICFDGKKVLHRSLLKIPGLHNVENFMTAMSATWDFVDTDAFVKTAESFTGVEHRMELTAEWNGIRFYNGSIDSSPSRTEAALSCFGEEYTGKIRIILGGYDKKIPFDTLAKPLTDKQCRLFVTGATREKIVEAVTSYRGYDAEKTPITECVNFDDAVKKACESAKSGDIVLLSPACASFDEFDNFESRGKRFKAMVADFVAGKK